VLKNLTRQPEQQALLLAQLGRLQENIGMFPAASLAYRDAIAMESPDRLNRAEEEADLQFRLAFSEIRMGLLSTAETAARRAVALRRAQVLTQPAGMADALNALGVVLTNRRVQLDEARDLLMQALALRSAASGPEAYQTGQIAGNLAQLELVALRLPEAHAWSKRALEIGEKQAQPVHVPRRLNVLAQILALQGRFDEALETARLGIQKCEVHFGPRNLYCMPIMATQGHILLQAGSPALALSNMDAAIAIAQEGGDVKSVLHALRLSRRADVLDTLAKHREADAAHAAALAMARQFGEARDLTRAQVTLAAAEFLVSQSRKTDAQALLREVLSVQTGQLSLDHPQQQKALQLAKRVGLPPLGP
jgi:tetratricopeptide (TPR) repeat protein